jgi:carboxypeptidase T
VTQSATDRIECHFTNARAPWLALAGLVAATAAASLWPSTQPQRRVAIRVDCSTPNACRVAESFALDVWSEHRGPGLPFDVVVAGDSLARLDAAHVPWQLIEADIDAAARAESERVHRPAALQPADFFADYKDYRAITERMIALAATAPERATIHGIGSTLDGRTIWALRIGRRNAKTPMMINGTQHAREWIAAMVTTCVADRLVREYDSDPAIRAFIDNTELWVVPVVNPDGYQYSWSSNRYWRKNRRGGYGVDLNRNFSVGWGGSGSSGRQGAQDYRGEYAFSEAESAALRDLAKREQIKLHVDFHSYGQLVLYPWNYSPQKTKDQDRYAGIGDRMASAMFAKHETRYRLQQGVELYPAAGTMTDWAYGEANALSYTIELRPRMGRGGFVLPPEEIRPTCDEGLAAVLALRTAER